MTEYIAVIAVIISLLGTIPALYLMRVQGKKQNADATSILVNTAMVQVAQYKAEVEELRKEVKKLDLCRSLLKELVMEVQALTYQLNSNRIPPNSRMEDIRKKMEKAGL